MPGMPKKVANFFVGVAIELHPAQTPHRVPETYTGAARAAGNLNLLRSRLLLASQARPLVWAHLFSFFVILLSLV